MPTRAPSHRTRRRLSSRARRGHRCAWSTSNRGRRSSRARRRMRRRRASWVIATWWTSASMSIVGFQVVPAVGGVQDSADMHVDEDVVVPLGERAGCRRSAPGGVPLLPSGGAVEGDDRFEPIALQPEEPRLGRPDEDGVGHRDARAFEVLHPGDRAPLGVGARQTSVPSSRAHSWGPSRMTAVTERPGCSTGPALPRSSNPCSPFRVAARIRIPRCSHGPRSCVAARCHRSAGRGMYP